MALSKIVRGCDFSMEVHVITPQWTVSGQIWEEFNINECTNVGVNLICTKDQVVIPLSWHIKEGTTNVIICDVQGKYLHSGAVYALEIVGLDAEGKAWRYKNKSVFAIVDATKDAVMQEALMADPLEVNAEIGLVVNVIPVLGPQGPQGDRGQDGVIGRDGAPGPQGPAGSQGDKGERGLDGQPGPQGPQGEKGQDGEVSFDDLTPEQKEELRGPQGLTGAQGSMGQQGEKGNTGPQGEKGDTGAQGNTGAQGDKGETGTQGDKGDVGPQGDKGETGPQGDKGETGAQGDKGETGPQGDKGETGPQGDKGETGAQGSKGNIGATGPQGSKGETGTGWLFGTQISGDEPFHYVNVTTDPISLGTMYNNVNTKECYTFVGYGPEDSPYRNIQKWQFNGRLNGPQGETGAQGDKGDVGPQGNMGQQGDKGDVGPQGERGLDGAQGPQGERGQQGPKGDGGDIDVEPAKIVIDEQMPSNPDPDAVYMISHPINITPYPSLIGTYNSGTYTLFLGLYDQLNKKLFHLGEYAEENNLSISLITNGSIIRVYLNRKLAYTLDVNFSITDGSVKLNDAGDIEFRIEGAASELGIDLHLSTGYWATNINYSLDFDPFGTISTVISHS